MRGRDLLSVPDVPNFKYFGDRVMCGRVCGRAERDVWTNF